MASLFQRILSVKYNVMNTKIRRMNKKILQGGNPFSGSQQPPGVTNNLPVSQSFREADISPSSIFACFFVVALFVVVHHVLGLVYYFKDLLALSNCKAVGSDPIVIPKD